MDNNNYGEYIKENWELITETLRNEYDIADISYTTWIKPLSFCNFKNDTLSILVPEDQAQAINYISKKYKTYFMVTITEMINHEININFILENDADKDEVNVKEKIYNINSENANLISKYRFDTFVVGNNNRFAHSA